MKGKFLGFDFCLFMPCGCLNFSLFENLPGFFLGVEFAQVPDQFDDAHAHEGGNEGDNDDQPRVGSIARLLGED